MATWGTPLSKSASRLLLLGSGELGKEVAIEAQRLGIETIAVDRYPDAPAMQVAHRSHVVDMTDPAALRKVIELEDPDWVVPEIEAIATPELEKLESEGFTIIPTAKAARLTMDREGIRRLAAETLKVPTSRYKFASSLEEFAVAVMEIGMPCVVKPTMSSSGKGQSVVRTGADVAKAWEHAMKGRVKTGRVIVESFIDFDYEITLLTVRHLGADGKPATLFCPPIGHVQVDGDYRESWQPMAMSSKALALSQDIARKVTDALGGRGLFGVELFVKGHQVWFSEVSPRPHDTGLVTLGSQQLSEFALHVRAITGLPIPDVGAMGPTASAVILATGESTMPRFEGVEKALEEPGTLLRLFGKPAAHRNRRMGVVIAAGETTEEAREKAKRAAEKVRVV
ncbi:MAG TPA: formate-dependent phosphoribosylglycinamide formyltransferase [Candidatus Thermoplasmatota archaeon]|nr:formate-dependent phosphoribosylglycinamide formyltransferase [Candidatus Thermoplasmatota archaeon]